ncbi:DUF5412 family protein [Radiobacillus sp. PE A8.2]|uniref:DUF5412 family protein n=1 Tax=Radiobacillus sp. PE A8.2 TaxID=3380349 RepID=UPI003890CD87
MIRHVNMWSFFLALFCLTLSCYSFYSLINHTWVIVPSNLVILFLTIIALIFGLLGFKIRTTLITKIRSWLTVIMSSFLIIVLFMALMFASMFSVDRQLIKTTQSPDEGYTIDLYIANGGATTVPYILGELNGPLWFKRKIYMEDAIDDVKVEWKDNVTVLINNHKLNINKGDEYFN